ncbi:unnamed protein product [Brassica oleracea var. botrytis]
MFFWSSSFHACLSRNVFKPVPSKRWRSVYLETRNVSFKETDFLSPSVNANLIKKCFG